MDPSRLMRARQVHGASVAVFRRGSDPGGSELPEVDILDLRRSGSCALTIQTADCVPILLADPAHGAVAAAHAGWRGLARASRNGAVAGLTREFGSRPADLVVAIGPSISGPRAMRSAATVRDRFEEGGFTAARIAALVLPAGRAGTLASSMAGSRRAISWRRLAFHRRRFTSPGCAPRPIPKLLCSYRRDGAAAGRLAGVIRAGKSEVGSMKFEVERARTSDFDFTLPTLMCRRRRPSPYWPDDRRGRSAIGRRART